MTELVIRCVLYMLLVGIGLGFRYHLLLGYNSITRKRVLFCEIMIVIIISCLFINNDNVMNIKDFTVTLLLFVGYIFYMMVKKIPKGYTESGLQIVNGYLITALSFMEFPWNLAIILIIIILSIAMFRFWKKEKRSDFVEIFFLCLELLVLSIYMSYMKIDDVIEITIMVVFVETVVYTFNCFIKYFIIWICGENTDAYWNELMGYK